MGKRKSNFELLRIVAMLMIVCAHYSEHGIMQVTQTTKLQLWSSFSIQSQVFSELLVPGAQIGVAIFFIISGFFNINKNKFSIKKVVTQTIFYGVFTSLLFMVLKIVGFASANFNTILYDLFSTVFTSVFSGVYWFVTVYVIIILIAPLLNNYLNSLNLKGNIIILVLFYIFGYVFAEFGGSYYFLLQRGLFFYLIGATLNKTIKYFKHSNMVYVCAFITNWLAYSSLNYIVNHNELIAYNNAIQKLLSRLCIAIQTDILVPIAAISLFMIFVRWDIKHSKFINSLGKTIFGVYLIHDSAALRVLIWNDALKVATHQINSKYFLLFAILSILGVFTTCVFIDLIRIRYIENRLLLVVDKINTKFKEKYLA